MALMSHNAEVELPWARDGVAWSFAGLTLLFHLVTIQGYGYFRDELYYLANAEHLGFGYVEHPPFIGLITALVRATLGDSRFAIRLLPAIAAAATVSIGVRLAREFGGGRFARALAGLSLLAMPGLIGTCSILSMNAFDVLCWAACALVVTRILRGGDERLWLLFGLLAGLGLENKISVLFLGVGLAAGLVLSRRWAVFRSGWLWVGGALAGLIFAPYVVWQAAHAWPLLEFMLNARRLKNVDLSFLAFMREQVLIANPLALPVWAAGLGYLLFARAARPFRAIGWIYPVVLAAMLAAGDAKPYYLIPAYTVLFAAGGVAIERFKASSVRAIVVGLVIVGGVMVAPLAKPVLPLETFVRYSRALGLSASSGERHALGRLPQMYADMQGWPELAETVAGVYPGVAGRRAREGLRVRPELRSGRGDRSLRPASRPAEGDLRSQQLLLLGAARLLGRRADRRRRQPQAARRTLRARRTRLDLPLRGLHALRGGQKRSGRAHAPPRDASGALARL